MKHLIIFSGSPASAVCAKKVSEKIDGLADDIELIYCQTYSEHIDTLRFIRQVSIYLDIPIRSLTSGKDLWAVIEEENRFPQGKENFCSKILKHDVLNKFFDSLTLDRKITIYFPFTIEDAAAAQKTAARMIERKIDFMAPLMLKGLNKKDCANIVENEWKIKLPYIYNLFDEVTCFPCVNKTCATYWQTIFKEYPIMFDKMSALETEIGNTIMPDISLEVLKKSIRKGKIILQKGTQGALPCDCGK